MLTVIDLNFKARQADASATFAEEQTNQLWQNDLCTIDGLSSYVGVSQLRRTLPRQLQTQELLLLGSNFYAFGFRATDLISDFFRFLQISDFFKFLQISKLQSNFKL